MLFNTSPEKNNPVCFLDQRVAHGRSAGDAEVRKPGLVKPLAVVSPEDYGLPRIPTRARLRRAIGSPFLN